MIDPEKYDILGRRKDRPLKPKQPKQLKVYSALSLWKSLYAQIFLHRARKFHENTNIDFDQFMILCSANCHYCDSRPINRHTVNNASNYIMYNGLDRVDNNVGYLLSNVVTACHVCNYMKRNTNKKDFINQCKQIASRF